MIKQKWIQLKVSPQIICAVILAIAQFTTNSALASEIRVHDCDGNLRASTELQEGQTKGLKFVLPNEESNAKAKLSRTESESVMELRAKEQLLVFSSIESGDWKICKEDGKTLAFNSVEFIEANNDSLRMASLVAGGAALVSGIAIASGDSDNSSGSSIVNINEPNEPDRAVSEKPVSSLESGSSARPSGEVLIESRCGKSKPSTLGATLDDEDCREGEEAPVISPYD